MIWNFDYSSISEIISLLKENNLFTTKRFGQNFLINSTVLEKITSLCNISSNCSVWEVGPGIGALSSSLLKSGAKLTAFEIDKGFCKILTQKAFVNCQNFNLVQGDVLKTWKTVFTKQHTPDVICSNLPYNIGSVFIADLIENRCLPEIMVYTLQTEVAKRICAKPGNPYYSAFSVLLSLDYECNIQFNLKKGCFFPSPNINSSVITMKKKEKPMIEEDFSNFFFKTVRVLFSNKRKTIKNNLKNLESDENKIKECLQQSNILPSDRAENLNISQIIILAKVLSTLQNNNIKTSRF